MILFVKEKYKLYIFFTSIVLFCSLLVFDIPVAAQCFSAFPYTQDFEATNGNWTPGGNASDWKWGTPNKTIIRGAGGGQKCWITGGLTPGSYNNNEDSYLESPCFNFTGVIYPIIKFKVYWDTELKFDGAALQYSINGGAWTNVGAAGDGANCLDVNWYNTTSITYLSNSPKNGWSGDAIDSKTGSGSWITASHALNAVANKNNVKFRFLFGAGSVNNNYDGFAVDDIEISNAPPIIGITASVAAPVNCKGDKSGSVTALINGGGTAPFTYSWNTNPVQNTQTATGLGAGTYTVTVGGLNTCPVSDQITLTEPSTRLQITGVLKNDVSCNSQLTGDMQAAVTGGVAPYTFTWVRGSNTYIGNPLHNVGAGIYQLIVTDGAGCAVMSSVTVNEPPPLSYSVQVVPATCGNANGSAMLTVSGGTLPYTYTWSANPSTTSSATGLLPVPKLYRVNITDGNSCIKVVEVQVPNSSGDLAVTMTNVVNVNCYNDHTGSATAMVSGGTGPYTYLWLPVGGNAATATNLPAGKYDIQVTDSKGCTAINSVEITQPLLLSSSITATHTSCGLDNGTATITAAGGTAPYSFLWTPGNYITPTISNLTAGNYLVVVTDANGCKKNDAVAISASTALQISSIAKTDVTCNGKQNGSANAIVANGVAPYTYTWKKGTDTYTGNPLENVGSGTYQLIVTDAAGCVANSSVTINEPAALSHAVQVTSAICGNANGSAVVTISGGKTPYTYLWSSNQSTSSSATNLLPGLYTVTITDANGCTDAVNFEIPNTTGDLAVTMTNVVNVNCFNDHTGSATATVSGGTGPYTYSWSPVGGNAATATNLPAGKYDIQVTDSKGCTVISSVEITQPLLLTSSITATPTSCGLINGTATINATGGTAPYTFLWTPGNYITPTISNLTAGSYSVVITDANGCKKNDAVAISASTALQISSIAKTDVTCNGKQNGSANAIVANGVAPYTYTWKKGTDTYTGNPLQNVGGGTYQLIVTDAAGCVANGSVTINEPAALSHTVQVTSAICGNANGSAAVAVSGGTFPYTYAWSSNQSTSTSATNLLPGLYTVTITDANGCTDAVNFEIPNTTGDLAMSVVNIINVGCYNDHTGSATATVSGGTGPYTYSWSPVGGNAATATNLPAGKYDIQVTDSKGCTAINSVEITQPLLLTSSVTATPTSCGLNNGTATITAAGGTAPYSFLWTPGNYITPTISNLTAGSYSVVITDANGCKKNDAVVISPSTALLISSITKTDVSCNGKQNGSANAIVANGVAPYTYTWKKGTDTYTGNPLQNVGSGTYQLTETDAAGCVANGSVTINEPAALSHNVQVTSAACTNATGTAAINETGGTAPYTFTWIPSVSSSSSAIQLAPGDYIAAILDANQCTDTARITITSSGIISATISNTTNVSCNGASNGSATVEVAGNTAPYTYSWSPSGGTNATANNLAAGTYIVTVTNQNGCTATATAVIYQPGAALQTITSFTNTTCGNNNGQASVNVVGGVSPYNYLWSNNTTSQNINSLSPEKYIVLVTDGKGCQKKDSVVIQPSTQPVITNMTHINVLCNGQNTGSASATVTSGTAPYTYLWTYNSNTYHTGTIQNVPAGNYNLTIADALGCSASSSVLITEPLSLQVSLTANPAACGSNVGSASANVSGGITPYQYLWSNGSNTSNVALNAGTYKLTVTDANHCIVNSNYINITAFPSLQVSLGKDTSMCPGNKIVLSPGNYTSYTWNDGSHTPAFTATRAGNYFVKVTNSAGCTASDTVAITVKCNEIMFPTAFTPNADGRNDGFGPVGSLSAVSNYTLRVYNRGGQQVFYTTDPFIKWYGKINGMEPGTGTFVWMAAYTFNGQPSHFQKGTITIIK